MIEALPGTILAYLGFIALSFSALTAARALAIGLLVRFAGSIGRPRWGADLADGGEWFIPLGILALALLVGLATPYGLVTGSVAVALLTAHGLTLAPDRLRRALSA